MKGYFQVIILVVFLIAAVFGVLVFSGVIPIGKDKSSGGLGTVVLWGTVSQAAVNSILDEFNNFNKTFSVQYVEKKPESFDKDLLEALASGKGPDMFFMPEDLVFSYQNKIFTIPYQSYSEATFKGTFVGAGEVFMNSRGVMAFPVAVDPMVMYYNRSMLDANGIVYPPTHWDQFEDLVPKLTVKDDANKISKSAVALGQFNNVNYAKNILATMFMQTGNPIVSEKGGIYSSIMDKFTPELSLGKVLEFYTDFANPLKSVYSWNRSLPQARDSFSSENLAFYFGYASELKSLINRNPNQNFLATQMPQLRGTTGKLTNAHVLGIAISSASKNFNTALTAASLMATGDFAVRFAPALGMVPARRDVIASVPADSFSSTFYASALYGRAWVDPSAEDTNDIFRVMIEKVLSNNLSFDDAVRDASVKTSLLLIK